MKRSGMSPEAKEGKARKDALDLAIQGFDVWWTVELGVVGYSNDREMAKRMFAEAKKADPATKFMRRLFSDEIDESGL